MATLSGSHRVFVAAVVVVAVFVCAVESSNFRRTRPSFGSSRRTRFGAPMGSSGRSRSSLLKPPPLFQEREQQQGLQSRGSGEWLRKHILDLRNKDVSTPVPTSRPIGKTITNTTIGPLKVNIIETIDVKKCNMTGRRNHQTSNEHEADSNETTPTTTNSRLAFTADEARIECGGSNEASQREECYRFTLSTDLNNATISGAIVLVSKTRSISDRTGQSNISIVAKFPTLGEGAFRESLSEQNVSFDVPKYWGHALLPQGASIISRALREGSILVLKMTVITESDGHAISSNYIPMNSKLLPVLLVDIEFNSTESSRAATAMTSSADSDDTPDNVVGRLLRRRRNMDELVQPLHQTSEDSNPLPHEVSKGLWIGDVTCTGYPGCCQRPAILDFNEALGWDFIIAPRWFQTTLCFGSCIPTNGSVAFSHYVLRGNLDTNITTPCVPSQIRVFDFLFFDENYGIIFGQFPGLVTVTGCSCGTTRHL